MTLIEEMAERIVKIRFEDLPKEVLLESKRILLDSIGCALAGWSTRKGKIAVELARKRGGSGRATIIGAEGNFSTFAASFANGELINALDNDVVHAPPGHVSPFVIPAPMALGEEVRASGRELILSLALAHEISVRFGSALSYYRDIHEEKVVSLPITGYSSTIFGGTVAASLILKLDPKRMAHALAIAGHITPVQARTKWRKTIPVAMPKYLMAGWICQAELMSALLASEGYQGDTSILEGEYGFWRYIGSSRWNPDTIIEKFGQDWRFPALGMYKLYPCCGITHAALGCFIKIIDENSLQPEEIEKVELYLQSLCEDPVFQNKEIQTEMDAQFSVAYPISVAAHRVPIGPKWQDQSTMTDPKILNFMEKVSFCPHPGYLKALREDPSSRLSRVEVVAKGKKYEEERNYWWKDTPIKDSDLIDKFRTNASEVLPSAKIDVVVESILELEKVKDVSQLWKHIR